MSQSQKHIASSFVGAERENHKHVEFARNKENLFDHWCSSKDVNKEFAKLHQLM